MVVLAPSAAAAGVPSPTADLDGGSASAPIAQRLEPVVAGKLYGDIAAGTARFLVVSFDSDWRFPTPHSQRIHEHLALAGAPSTFVELASPWGHDSFLLDPPGYHDRVRAFLG